MLTNSCEFYGISQIFPKAVKTVDLSFQGNIQYDQSLRKEPNFIRNSCHGDSISKMGIWQYSHPKCVRYKIFHIYTQKHEDKNVNLLQTTSFSGALNPYCKYKIFSCVIVKNPDLDEKRLNFISQGFKQIPGGLGESK